MKPTSAFDLIERWNDPNNKATERWLANDTDFDNIRDHPRFKALLRPIAVGGRLSILLDIAIPDPVYFLARSVFCGL